MSVKIIGRRPIFNIKDNLFYMCEITEDMVYRVHHENNNFLGFSIESECISQYVKYFVSSFLEQNTKQIRNFDPDFSPSCYLNKEQLANYSINLFGTYLLVNNLENVDAITAWFIDKGNIVF